MALAPVSTATVLGAARLLSGATGTTSLVKGQVNEAVEWKTLREARILSGRPDALAASANCLTAPASCCVLSGLTTASAKHVTRPNTLV